HWEGDTLVIDTVNFNGKTRLDTIGHPHSDQLHLVQRLSRPDLGHVVHEMLIDDPKTFTTSWKVTRTFTLRTDWEMMESSGEKKHKGRWKGRTKPPKFRPLSSPTRSSLAPCTSTRGDPSGFQVPANQNPEPRTQTPERESLLIRWG